MSIARNIFIAATGILYLTLFLQTYAYSNSNVNGKWTLGAYATPSVFKVKPISMKLCESFDVQLVFVMDQMTLNLVLM